MTVRIANSSVPSDAAVNAPHFGVVLAVLNWLVGLTRGRRRSLLRLRGQSRLRASLAAECESACNRDHRHIWMVVHSFSPCSYQPVAALAGLGESAAVSWWRASAANIQRLRLLGCLPANGGAAGRAG